MPLTTEHLFLFVRDEVVSGFLLALGAFLFELLRKWACNRMG